MKKNDHNQVNPDLYPYQSENPLAIFKVYYFYLKYSFFPILIILFIILLTGFIMLFSICFINDIIINHIFQISQEETIIYSIILALLISAISLLFIFNKTKKILNFKNNNNKIKDLLKIRKDSKIIYVNLILLSYLFRNTIFILLIIAIGVLLILSTLRDILYIFSNNKLLIFIAILSLLLFPKVLISIIGIIYVSFVTPISVFKIMKKAKTNPILVDYIAIKLTSKEFHESMEIFFETNEDLELIINFPELLNYISYKLHTEKPIEERSPEEINKIIKEIDEIIKLIKRYPFYDKHIISELKNGKNLDKIKENLRLESNFNYTIPE